MFTGILTIVSFTTFSQTIIPKAGLAVSSSDLNSFSINVGGNYTAYQVSFIAGFTAGLAYRMTISPGEKSTLSLQPEINFIQKGYKAKSTVIVSENRETHSTLGKETFQLNYIEVPLLLTFDFGAENSRIHFLIGPSLASSLGGTYKNESSSNANGITISGISKGKIKFGEEPASNTSNYYLDNRMDVGFQFGGGITLLKKVIADIRYYMGVNNLQKDQSSRNKAFQFTLGLPLTIKK